MGIKLRPYQNELIEAILPLWKAGKKKVLCQLPTGGG